MLSAVAVERDCVHLRSAKRARLVTSPWVVAAIAMALACGREERGGVSPIPSSGASGAFARAAAGDTGAGQGSGGDAASGMGGAAAGIGGLLGTGGTAGTTGGGRSGTGGG